MNLKPMTKKNEYDLSITCHYFVKANSEGEALDLFHKASEKGKTFPNSFDPINIYEVKDLTVDNILNLMSNDQETK